MVSRKKVVTVLARRAEQRKKVDVVLVRRVAVAPLKRVAAVARVVLAKRVVLPKRVDTACSAEAQARRAAAELLKKVAAELLKRESLKKVAVPARRADFNAPRCLLAS